VKLVLRTADDNSGHRVVYGKTTGYLKRTLYHAIYLTRCST